MSAPLDVLNLVIPCEEFEQIELESARALFAMFNGWFEQTALAIFNYHNRFNIFVLPAYGHHDAL